jgi:hypothetical protein
MIPRYQKIVFVVLLVVSIVMAVVLVRLRERAHDRLLKGEDIAPTTAPAIAPAEQATLMIANDLDGTLAAQVQSLPLPKDSGARARALLEKLVEVYASAGSRHSLPVVSRSVEQVFLLPAKGKGLGQASGELAVVNLSGRFADSHPAGIEAETLTIESICQTLHANLPQITEVRFLVDGQTRATLAGHADLTRTYLTTEAVAAGSSAVTGATP